ncbi:MAG: hypothetical protein U5N58_02850 [Actinomycetota bacterium]|nr:hypothetical protein [Actinomycetota bacterium]
MPSWSPRTRKLLLNNLGSQRARQIIMDLSPDDRTEVFGDLPGPVTQKLLNILPPDQRRESLALLCYSEDSVGRLMTPEYIAVKPFLAYPAGTGAYPGDGKRCRDH